jgi:hypothetical protein
MKMANWKMKSPRMASSMKSTHWKMESPRMTSPIVKKMTSPIIKRLSIYVDFLGVEDILNSPNNDDEFYTGEENYMFIREVTVDPFMSIFMAHGREKEQEKYGKSKELTSGVWGVHDRHQGIPIMRSITLILGCCLVLILRKDDCSELTGHLKDRGKD